MLLKELVAPPIKTLTDHYQTYKLLLIHPSSRYRTLLIAALTSDPPCPLYYYGLSAGDVGLEHFLTSLAHDLADQSPTFGRHINHTRHQTTEDFEQLAEALAGDLNELCDEDYLLIIDEYDYADIVPGIQSFIECLLNHLPPHCHLLINSRTLPRLPWMALAAKHQAVILRDAQMLTSGSYSEYDIDNPNVEVFALGPGYVMINGQPGAADLLLWNDT